MLPRLDINAITQYPMTPQEAFPQQEVRLQARRMGNTARMQEQIRQYLEAGINTNVSRIYDPNLLQEMINYNPQSDRVIPDNETPPLSGTEEQRSQYREVNREDLERVFAQLYNTPRPNRQVHGYSSLRALELMSEAMQREEEERVKETRDLNARVKAMAEAVLQKRKKGEESPYLEFRPY